MGEMKMDKKSAEHLTDVQRFTAHLIWTIRDVSCEMSFM